MKNKIKKLGILIMSLCLVFTSSMPVFASDAAEVNGGFDAEQYATEELNSWAEDHGIGVRFEDFHITPVNDGMSEAEIEESTRSYVEMMKESMDNMFIEVTYKPNKTRTTGKFTASGSKLVEASYLDFPD